MVALAAAVAALITAGWPDLNTLSVRLVIATAILFGFVTAAFIQVLRQGSSQHLGTEYGAGILTSQSGGRS